MKPEPASSWDTKMQRRREFCERFVREHHPGMADASKGARPLVPLEAARRIYDGPPFRWWLETDESMFALGGTWIAHLFNRHNMLDHDWFIGRDDQEPWALISEPYAPPATAEKLETLRHELTAIGVELLVYPKEQSTHAPGHALPLVANVVDHHRLMGAVARLIVADCEKVTEGELATAKVQFFLHVRDYGVLTDSAGVVCAEKMDPGWYALYDDGSQSGRLMGPYASKRDAEHNYYALKGGGDHSD
jgi:hypothetical protein